MEQVNEECAERITKTQMEIVIRSVKLNVEKERKMNKQLAS